MRSVIFATAVALTLPAIGHAQIFRAVNDLNVVPLSASSFEVIEARGAGPRGMWCAAAEYAEQRLGARDRVYIQGARGPARSVQGRKSVVFTTNAGNLPRGPFQSAFLSTSQTGIGLPVAHAIQFCRDRFDKEDRIWNRN
jgi:hypothetical protein